MHLDIDASDFPEITEIWGVTENQIEVSVSATRSRPHNHRVRITALENLRSGATPRYFAHYEREVTVRDTANQEHEVWVEADYPWQDGETVEECLKASLLWLVTG